MDARELEALAPTPGTVEAGGKTHELFPVPWERIPAFARAIKPLIDPEAIELPEGEQPLDTKKLLAQIDWVQVLDKNHASVTQLIEIGSGVPAAELGGYAWPDVVALACEVILVNADFFNRRALPAVKRVWGAWQQAMGVPANGAGSTASAS